MPATADRQSLLADWLWDNPAAVMVARTRHRPKSLLAIYVAGPLVGLAAYPFLAPGTIIALPLGLLLILPAVHSGVAGQLFVKDRDKFLTDHLRLTMLTPGQIICGRFIALFHDFFLPLLLALAFMVAALALDRRLPPVIDELGQLSGITLDPRLLAPCLLPLLLLFITCNILCGFACGTAVRHPIGALIAAVSGGNFISLLVPGTYLYMLESIFGKTPTTLTPGLIVIFFMLWHLLAAYIMLLAVHQHLCEQDNLHDNN